MLALDIFNSESMNSSKAAKLRSKNMAFCQQGSNDTWQSSLIDDHSEPSDGSFHMWSKSHSSNTHRSEHTESKKQ